MSSCVALTADLPLRSPQVILAGALGAVVDAMARHVHRVELQRKGCSLLYYVAAGSDGGRAAVVAAHGIDATVRAMHAHSRHVGLLEDGCAPAPDASALASIAL